MNGNSNEDREQIEERPVRAAVPNTRRRFGAVLICTALALFALLLVSSLTPGTASATPPQGVSQTPIATGVLPDAVRAKFKQAQDQGFGDGLDVSNIQIVKNIVLPGGYFGWHQHSGPSWVVVTQGTLTFYEADDPSCTGHPVSAGSAYFDPGDHTHNARNETGQVVENYVVRMLPQGGAPRIDVTPGPSNCPF